MDAVNICEHGMLLVQNGCSSEFPLQDLEDQLVGSKAMVGNTQIKNTVRCALALQSLHEAKLQRWPPT